MSAAQEIQSGESSGDEQLPRKFDRYELLKKLATGGMAEIFLAKQSGLEGFEKVVVLKRILPHLAQDEEFVSMFLDEARIAAKLSHPNVVQIYDLGKADGTYYIAMEYVSGRNVQHLIGKAQQRGEMTPVEHVCRILAGVCDGLHYAHSRKDYDGTPLNIVHRDISPQNVLVSFAGGVKVVDFGIAKASTQLAQTRAGVLKGKYAYMSPEQVRGAKIDHRSDVFAVGLVMYEMLTGVRAFERDSSLKTLKAIVQEKPLNPRELNPDVPMEVVKLLSKALEKNPDRRYKTAQEMQLALEDYLEASPKKSNNVRLSRYMYDIFDDELNAKDGTMVVKGIGEVIIPASQGMNLVPKIEEDVDHNTLSAALMPVPADKAEAPAKAPDKKPDKPPDKQEARPAAEKAADRTGDRAKRPEVKKEESKPEQPKKEATPPRPMRNSKGDDKPPTKPATEQNVPAVKDTGEDDSYDGRTVPAYSVEDYERERAARGVNDGGGGGDARAAELLAKVDAMAASGELHGRDSSPTATLPARTIAETSAPTRFDGIRRGDDELSPKPSMVVGPNGMVESTGPRIRPPAKMGAAGQAGAGPTPAPPVPPTVDTPPSGHLEAAREPTREPARRPPPRAPAPTVKLPPMVYAGLGTSIGLFVLTIVSFVVFFVVGGGAGAVEYGVVAVASMPPGAVVVVDGVATGSTPTQVALALDERTHVVELKLKGHKDGLSSFTFEGKDLVELPVVELTATDAE
ncbi:MAG: serine/threonine protein kinase [Deltaproteobacteria bacterium]|nr:serine/threonine protein kinase [Deltaproteobacteria bacterium]